MEGSVCSCDGDTMQDELVFTRAQLGYCLALLTGTHERLFILLIFLIVKLNKPLLHGHVTERFGL